MRKPEYYIGVFLLLLVAIACNKDKLNTRPTIKVKDVRNRFVPTGDQTPLIVEFDYADKEGDVSNSIFIEKIRLNQLVVPLKTDPFPDTFSLKIPDLGLDKPDGQIEIHLLNTELEMALNPPDNQPDTIKIRFALRDKAGNVSDTIEVTPVFVQR